MERRGDVRELFGYAPETEASNDELTLPLRQRVDCCVELRELVASRRVARGIDGRGVGEQLVERRVERRPPDGHRAHLRDDVERQADRVRELERRRLVPFGCRELGLGPGDRAAALDDAFRQPNESRPLGERVPNRAADLEAGEGLEVDATRRVERPDRVEQPDAALLHEVVERDVQPAVVRGDRSHRREMLCHEMLACAAVAPRLFERRHGMSAHRRPRPRRYAGMQVPASGRTTDRYA